LKDRFKEFAEREVWETVFKNSPDEAAILDGFLAENLHAHLRHRLGHHGRVIIVSPTKDDSFKAGEWLRHNNPLNRELLYSVVGWKHGRIVFLSACHKCRAGEGNHLKHAAGRG